MNDNKIIAPEEKCKLIDIAISPEALVQRGENEIVARTFSHKLIKLSPAQIEDVIAYSDRLLKNQYNPLP